MENGVGQGKLRAGPVCVQIGLEVCQGFVRRLLRGLCLGLRVRKLRAEGIDGMLGGGIGRGGFLVLRL